MKTYQFFADGSYASETEDFGRMPHNATHTAPPERPWKKVWPKWTGSEWVLEEDHRERSPQLFGEDAQDATDYWLPGDDWQSEPRKMTKPGPLPEGALLTRPEKPEEEKLEAARAAKIDEIEAGYEAALAASLTMPMGNPTSSDVAIGAALFAVDDAEGLDYISQAHAYTRDALMADAYLAESVEDVEAIKVAYAV